MTKRVLILGGGTGGTMMANKLVRALVDDAWTITVVDRDDLHLYQPGLLFLPFGQYRASEIVRPRKALLDPRVKLVLGEIDRVAPDSNEVAMKSGVRLAYDVLIVATGSRLAPEQTQGLTGAGWKETAFDFYTLEGALALRDAFENFKGGRLVVNVVDMPIKCPVAPAVWVPLLSTGRHYACGLGRSDTMGYEHSLHHKLTNAIRAGQLSELGVAAGRRYPLSSEAFSACVRRVMKFSYSFAEMERVADISGAAESQADTAWDTYLRSPTSATEEQLIRALDANCEVMAMLVAEAPRVL